jgi:hypothetical protein
MVDSEINNSSDHCRCAVEEGVLSRPVGSDAVLLDLNSHYYFGLNEVGARIWAALADGCSGAEIVEIIVHEFEVDKATAERDVADLLTELEHSRLIRKIT